MKRVAVLAFDGISPFHLGVPTSVFGGIDSIPGRYDVVVCADPPGSLATQAGYEIVVRHGLEAFADAHMVAIPSWSAGKEVPETLAVAIQEAHARGARIVGLCLGAWVVAASGIVDGREVATHWAAAEMLAARYPDVAVRPDVLWCDLGDVITSAGVAAALDTCLHVVRTDHGNEYAAALARGLVIAPHRVGSQKQFIPAPVAAEPTGDAIDQAMEWARARLAEPVSLASWSAAVHLSVRSFSRRFSARTGTSPGQWLLERRLDRARSLLETTDLGIDQVASASGMGSAVTLRYHFARHYCASPAAHRATFRTVASNSSGDTAASTVVSASHSGSER